MYKVYQQKNKGFTLVETLVAIAILMLALTAPMLIAFQGVGSASYAKDQVTANYLAQDAMDYIIAKKNGNIMANAPWLTGLTSCGTSNGCTIDTTKLTTDATAIAGCSSTCSPLNFDTSTNEYQHRSVSSVNTPSEYTRKIIYSTINDGNGAAVSVIVSWNTSGFKSTNSFTLRTNIFNIKP